MNNKSINKIALTKENVENVLSYDPITGIFIWKEKRGCAQKGSIAGSISPNGYILIRVYNNLILAHRLAYLVMTGSLPSNDIDHIDGFRGNNKWSNLRPVTKAENAKNRRISTANTSGFTGVFWNKYRDKWTAQIKLFGKDRHLGHFKNLEDAIKARKDAEKELNFHKNHGDVLYEPDTHNAK